MHEQQGPLSGYRVLELGNLIAAPYAGRALGVPAFTGRRHSAMTLMIAAGTSSASAAIRTHCGTWTREAMRSQRPIAMIAAILRVPFCAITFLECLSNQTQTIRSEAIFGKCH